MLMFNVEEVMQPQNRIEVQRDNLKKAFLYILIYCHLVYDVIVSPDVLFLYCTVM